MDDCQVKTNTAVERFIGNVPKVHHENVDTTTGLFDNACLSVAVC